MRRATAPLMAARWIGYSPVCLSFGKGHRRFTFPATQGVEGKGRGKGHRRITFPATQGVEGKVRG